MGGEVDGREHSGQGCFRTVHGVFSCFTCILRRPGLSARESRPRLRLAHAIRAMLALHREEPAMSRIAVVPLAATLLLSLAACAPMPPTTGGPPPTAFQCVAQPGAWAIGQAATAEVVERIRVDTHSRIARVLRPGQAVTMEFSAERVNVNVNDRNAIIGVTCG
jgi:hypothetical protein